MSFISYEFMILFACVAALYGILNHRGQNLMLLVASYIFYGWWDYRFLSLIFFSSVLNYFCALYADPQQEPAPSERQRNIALICSIIVNLGLLGFFKYFNFFADSCIRLLQWFGFSVNPLGLHIILPIGISFYTFQTMSYVIDVYRGDAPATKRFGDVLLYVSFFPQILSGPIERGTNLLPQILSPREVTWEKVCSGTQLAFWGFFKKMVIADNLSIIVNNIFNQSSYTGAEVLIATYAFAFQIYCDFSGYTDIARGITRILGFDICVNFRLPYFAVNPNDFWQRWHISLSRWFRDYLYLPLAFSNWGRVSPRRMYVIVIFVFLVTGLWHGASWHFVVWGAYHGILLAIYRLFVSLQKTRRKASSTPRTDAVFWLKVLFFFQVTCFGWLIFKVNNLTQLIAMTKAILTTTTFAGLWTASALQVVIFSAPLILFQVYQHVTGEMEPWKNWSGLVKVPYYATVFYAIVLLGSPIKEAFIYFQF